MSTEQFKPTERTASSMLMVPDIDVVKPSTSPGAGAQDGSQMIDSSGAALGLDVATDNPKVSAVVDAPLNS
jgi:hypothetical protein